MALAAAARRSLASRHSSRLHAGLPHLLAEHCSGDATTTPSPLHPPQPLFRSPHFPLPQSSRTAAQTLSLFPFGVHLAGAGPSRCGFSSLPPHRVADAGAVLTGAAAAPAAPASLPSEVAWITEDSSLSVVAVQHLIDAVHSFTGLNWWLSIAVSTVLLRSMLLTLLLSARKQIRVAHQESSAVATLLKSAKDEKSEHEAVDRARSFLKSLGPLVFISILRPYTFMALYFAISNMVQKLPSLKEGGAFWFTDLTTPDALYIFPAMVSLSLLLRLEFSLHYTKRERSLRTDIVRILLVLTFPFAASFPKAICCYFVTWNFASLAQTIGPTAEDSAHPVDENEEPLPPEGREASDSSIDQVKDKSDKESEKDS
ncbi:mitochondrial inner membrane protein OXA1 isoform X2 [Setaria italica]|uniref:mitochondrial inner membrane protein OXA1 isoform X2 n=1 Tax=Setaria italica TaxID=4555 RepID=UPI000BE5CFD9|nr:mitochondrial inner membrane protein OXA1 isoform X2 [Setaria italica]